MSNPEVETLIAANLDKIPDPDNSDRYFMFIPYNQFPGQHEEHQQLIAANCARTARGLVLLLENNGKTIIDTADVTPPPAIGSRPIISLYCASCAGLLLQTTQPVSRDGKLSVPPTAINPSCEAKHGVA